MACGCSQLLQSTDASFGRSGENRDAGVEAGLAPELACFDEARAPRDRGDVEFVAFNKKETTTFSPVDGGIELSDYIPLVGVSIIACSVADPYCDHPTTPPVATDDAGIARLSLPRDFDGFYDLRRDDLLPTTYFPGAPSSRVATYYLALYPTDIATYILATFNVSLNTERGHIAAAVYDCDHLPLETAAVDTDAEFDLAPYFTTGSPSLPTKDPSGARIFVNVPVGEATVTARVNGRMLGARKVYVRSGNVAIVDFLGR